MNISNLLAAQTASLENNLQALNAQMQSYFASEEELIYSNSFKVSNIGSEAEPIDDDKLYIRTNYMIPFRINANEYQMVAPPDSYMEVINATVVSLRAPEDVPLAQPVISCSPIIGNLYWSNGALYASRYTTGISAVNVTTNADSRWFYTDAVRNAGVTGPTVTLYPGDTFGYTLEPNTEYVPNAGQSAYESNFNFLHDGNLIVENADVNQLRGRDVSVIISNSNFNASNFESPTLVNSRLYDASMNLDNLDTIRPAYLRAKKPNGKIANSNFYNAKLNFQAYINEFTATNMVVDNTLHDRDIPFEWDNFNVPNVSISNDKHIKLPYIADNSVLAINNNVVAATTQDLVTSNLAFDYVSGYNTVYKHALDDFNNFVKDSEQQFNDITNNRGEEQYQELYDEINASENKLISNITHHWNVYWDTLNNVNNTCNEGLKNMVNYPISNTYATFSANKAIEYFDIAFNGNTANNYSDVVSNANYNFYIGDNIELQGKTYNGNLAALHLNNSFIWQQNNTSNMFANCINLREVYNYIPLGLVDASNMFANCINLTTPIQFYSNTVENLVNFLNASAASTSIMNVPYVNIRVNQNLNIVNFIAANATSAISITSETPKYIMNARFAFNGRNITDINLANLSIIGSADRMCPGASNLVSFTGNIKAADAQYMFDVCNNLKSDINIDIDETSFMTNTINYVHYQYAFNNTSIAQANINVDIPNVYYLANYFSSINFSNAFSNCRNLEDVNFNFSAPYATWIFGTPTVSTFTNMFANCSNLKNVNIIINPQASASWLNLDNILSWTVNFQTTPNIYVKIRYPQSSSWSINTFGMISMGTVDIDSLTVDLSEWRTNAFPFNNDSIITKNINNLTILFGNEGQIRPQNYQWLAILGVVNHINNVVV